MIPNPKLILAGSILLAFLGLAGWGYFEHNRFIKKSLELTEFVSQTQINAAVATAEKARKEKEDAERIQNAVIARDAAINKLRQHQASAASSRLPFLPASTENRVCLNRTQFESAIGSLVTDLQGLVGEGDIALIDLQTFIESWPK